MIFADLNLARKLEHNDAILCGEYARAHAQIYPEAAATSMQIMGGYATYAGADSPITQAFGLGLSGEVSEAELITLEDFYRSRNASVNIELCPLADAGLLKLLMQRGYRITEYSNALFNDLQTIPAINVEAVVRIPDNYEDELWSRIITLGFTEAEEPAPAMMEVAATMFHTKISVPFLVEIDNKPAGGGAVSVHDHIADFYAQATLPAFRGRGAQTALIQAGLTFAASQGCGLAMATTLCGSISQRNFERQGFRIAYTRTKLIREWS